MYKPQKSEIEQQIFFRKSYDKFLQAKDAAGEINFYYRIGNTTICLKFAGNELDSIPDSGIGASSFDR